MAVQTSMCHAVGLTGCGCVDVHVSVLSVTLCDCVDIHVSCGGCDFVLTSMCHVVGVTVC